MNDKHISPGKSRGQARKDKIREILQKRDFEALKTWAESERSAIRTVSSLLFEPDELICWRAVEALGRVAAAVEAERDEEKIRQLLRRLFWQMNDESGNLGWYSPQAIAEVIYNLPHLAYEYTPILASYLYEEPFEKGVRLGLVRINEVNPDAVRNSPAVDIMLKTFGVHDESIRAFTIYTLAKIGAEIEPALVEPFKDGSIPVRLYNFDTGEIEQIPVSEFAGVILKN